MGESDTAYTTQEEAGYSVPESQEIAEELISAKVLCLKLFLSPQTFTLIDLIRLQELMISLGYM